jgi:hypothetical protein
LQLFHMLLSIAFTQNYDSWSLMFWAAIFTFKLWGRSDSDRFMYDFDVYQPVQMIGSQSRDDPPGL